MIAQHPRTAAQGFTLVEWSSGHGHCRASGERIVFPVFAQTRGKARQATCLSNLKQLGLAHLMYWQDYDQTTVDVVVVWFSG